MKKVDTLSEYPADEERIDREDLEAINFESSLISKIVEARESQGISQRELARITGIKQPAVARLESKRSTSRVGTLLEILIPLGYTLEIVPLPHN